MAIAPQQQATAVKTNMSVKAKIISQNSDLGHPGNGSTVMLWTQWGLNKRFYKHVPSGRFFCDPCLFGLSVTLSSMEAKHSTKKLVYCRLEY